jgi:hypothetical protein
MAIKLSIVGINWKRWLSDYETNYTLCSTRNENSRYNRTTKFGLVDVNAINDKEPTILKDFTYIEGQLRTYLRLYTDENGIIRKIPYLLQRYSRSIGGGQVDAADYFYFLYQKDALVNQASEHYLKGRFFESTEGDEFIKSKLESGEFRKM